MMWIWPQWFPAGFTAILVAIALAVSGPIVLAASLLLFFNVARADPFATLDAKGGEVATMVGLRLFAWSEVTAIETFTTRGRQVARFVVGQRDWRELIWPVHTLAIPLSPSTDVTFAGLAAFVAEVRPDLAWHQVNPYTKVF